MKFMATNNNNPSDNHKTFKNLNTEQWKGTIIFKTIKNKFIRKTNLSKI